MFARHREELDRIEAVKKLATESQSEYVLVLSINKMGLVVDQTHDAVKVLVVGTSEAQWYWDIDVKDWPVGE